MSLEKRGFRTKDVVGLAALGTAALIAAKGVVDTKDGSSLFHTLPSGPRCEDIFLDEGVEISVCNKRGETAPYIDMKNSYGIRDAKKLSRGEICRFRTFRVSITPYPISFDVCKKSEDDAPVVRLATN